MLKSQFPKCWNCHIPWESVSKPEHQGLCAQCYAEALENGKHRAVPSTPAPKAKGAHAC